MGDSEATEAIREPSIRRCALSNPRRSRVCLSRIRLGSSRSCRMISSRHSDPPSPKRSRRRSCSSSSTRPIQPIAARGEPQRAPRIGADAVPSRLLLNKIDRMDEAERVILHAKHPDAILLSAISPADVAVLREEIIAFFETLMVEDQLVLPYAKHGLLSDIYENARVLSENYDITGRIIKVRGPARRDSAAAKKSRRLILFDLIMPGMSGLRAPNRQE